MAILLIVVLGLATAPLISQTQAQRKPLTKSEVMELLQNEVPSARIETLSRQYNISFEVTAEAERDLREAGATDTLLKALRELAPKPSSPTPPATAPPVLVIEANPGGAQVYVDDEPVGKTSGEGRLKLSALSAGPHRVRLSLLGYRDREQKVELAAGESVRLVLSLEPEKAAETSANPEAQPKEHQIQDWMGTWVFAGKGEVTTRCGRHESSVVVPGLSFKVFSALPSGEVTAHVQGMMGSDALPPPAWCRGRQRKRLWSLLQIPSHPTHQFSR